MLFYMTSPEKEQTQQTAEALVPQKEEVTKKEQINAQAVFPEGKSSETQALGQTLSQLNIQLETLRKLQAEHPTPERLVQIAKLERQWGLASRFALLQSSGTDEQKQIIEKKETPEQLRASDVLFLKKKWVDLANLLLVPTWDDGTKSTNSNLIKEGKDKSFIVNFWENKNVDNIIGAGDILPTTVKHVKINGVEGERKNIPRPGYYDMKSGKYLPIHDGDTIEIMFTIKAEDDTEAERKAASIAEDAWLREQRIEDMIDNEGKALSNLPEDKELEEKAQEEIKQRKEIRESIGTMREGHFIGTTRKPISETVKALKDLNAEETNNLLRKVFGEGPWTDLLIKIDGGNTVAIKRMITLAYHEGGLLFGRQNKDPASGFNIGTFQIGWRDSTPESSLNKYESCLQTWIKLAGTKSVSVDYEAIKNDPAQRDLLTHLGYIQLQRGGERTFDKLKDPNLSDGEVMKLMSDEIQVGIDAIGISVVSQINNTRIDLEKIQSA